MNILAIPATNSRDGINRRLLGYVGRILTDQHQAAVDLVDINDYEMPIYSPDREQAGGPPAQAHALFERIGSADAIVISFAEHNGSYSAAWKNIYDWMSRIDQKVFQNKPVVVLAATPGGRAGASVVGAATSLIPHAGAQLVGSLGVGTFGTTFDSDAGTITNASIAAQLNGLLAQLVTAAA